MPSFVYMAANQKSGGLLELVESQQASGRYVLTREQASGWLDVSDEALRKAVRRLVGKRRLAVPRRGFYVVVPLEYREAGAPPAPWFIDELMSFHEQHYYVGILSAAALHGAGHQQPQEFQVVTTSSCGPLSPAVRGSHSIRLGSSQSRVAKMEAADASVSVDLLLKSLLALGATRKEVGQVIARAA